MLAFNLTAEGLLNGEGITGVRVAQADCVYKANIEGAPFIVANEWACYRLAEHIGLPVPKAGVGTVRGKPVFISMHFSTASAPNPPPINPRVVLADHPFYAHGIIAFDILVANCDRHIKNAAILRSSNAARREGLVAFDHSHALYGCLPDNSRIGVMFERLGIALTQITGVPGAPATAGNPHCLGMFMTDGAPLNEWFSRIKSVPDWFFEDLRAELVFHDLLDATDATALTQWLRSRARRIDSLFMEHQREFPLIQQQIIPTSPVLTTAALTQP